MKTSFFIILSLTVLCVTIPSRWCHAQTNVAPDVTDAHSWVTKLGDPSFDVRSQATRQLCKLGPAAVEALRQAAKGDDFEIAFRARHLLESLEHLYFTGLEISIQGTKSEIAWDEPFDVVVKFRNVSAHPSKIPLEAASDTSNAVDDVRQVTSMIDLADFIRVTAPDGKPIHLHVDDIREDPRVAEAVESRLTAGPEQLLPASGAAEYVVRHFNRGFSRYPTLTDGGHTLQFVYTPEWDDDELRRSEAGKVESTPWAFKVTRKAPPGVSEPGVSCRLTVSVSGSTLVAMLTHSSDLPVQVNQNLGTGGPPFAELNWEILADSEWLRLRTADSTPKGIEQFDSTKVVKLDPAGRLSLGKIDSELLVALARENGIVGGPITYRATYSNLTDRVWQRDRKPPLLGRSDAPGGLREPLPRRMVFGRSTSEDLVLNPDR